VDAVSGGANDFRHVGPHGIEPGSHKGASITGPGHRNFSGMSLVPEPVDDIRTPVFISQCPIFRINDPGKNTSGAFLNTAETTFTGIQVFGLLHGAHVQIVVLENSVNTFFLYACSATAGAVFPEFHRGIFADGMIPRVGGFNGDMILLRHLTLQHVVKILNFEL
jgi:hypothetical protein